MSLKKLCYSCSNVAVLSLSIGGTFREVCSSCYQMWQMRHLAPNRNRVKGSSLPCNDGCGKPAVVIMPQPTVGPYASMPHGATATIKTVAVCSECADVRRLESLEATNPGHHPQGSQAEALLERLAGDSDDFSSIPSPIPSPNQGNYNFTYRYVAAPLCPQCGIRMGQSLNIMLWCCPQCGAQMIITP